MLIECKKADSDLCDAHISQLHRYFGVTETRIALLTNGIEYRFFSDLEKNNKMDNKPFLIFDIVSHPKHVLDEVRKLCKDSFDLECVISAASDLKYTAEIRQLIQQLTENPDEDFAGYVFHRIQPHSRFSSSLKDWYRNLVQRAFQQAVSDTVSHRLRLALEKEEDSEEDKIHAVKTQENKGIDTTGDEIEAFYIIKAIVSNSIIPERVYFKDRKSYATIRIDDKTTKVFCRLYFNSQQKHIVILHPDKDESRIPIENTADIYAHINELREAVIAHAG
jgi:hypothetical protein